MRTPIDTDAVADHAAAVDRPDDSRRTEPASEEARRPRTIGTTVILAGVLVLVVGLGALALTAYDLWGTGLRQAKSQAELSDDFEGLLAEHQVIGAAPDSPAGGASPPANAPTEAAPPAADFADGSVIGHLWIPDLGVEQFVVEGVDEGDLQKGPGHYPQTTFPGLGGNAAIAGHRTTWGAPFNRINELDPGDEIHVAMPWGTFIYEVVGQGPREAAGHFIVDPDETWVLDDTGEDALTLTSCHPLYSARERIVVVAELVRQADVPAAG